MSGTPATSASNGNRTVPIGSACTIGLRDTRPRSRAVGSPSRSAVHACADSCTVRENSRTMKAMKTCAKLMSMENRLRPTREKGKDGIGHFAADDRLELLPRRAPYAREASERRQERPPAPRADAGDVVELRVQIAHRPRAAMEGHGKAMRLVADALNEEQTRLVRRERNRIVPVPRIQQLLLLGDADRHQIRETERLERPVRGRQLALAAVDHDQVGERSSLFEHLPIASEHDFVHGGEVIMDRGWRLEVRGWAGLPTTS